MPEWSWVSLLLVVLMSQAILSLAAVGLLLFSVVLTWHEVRKPPMAYTMVSRRGGREVDIVPTPPIEETHGSGGDVYWNLWEGDEPEIPEREARREEE